MKPLNRILLEEREFEVLHLKAFKSRDSLGRKRDEHECPMRTCFQRDRDRIIHSKSFRRLKHKTQVFLSPAGDHFRTRLTHTLEVSQIARTIATLLNLNENLVEAISLGHDLGHTPFGHAGERVISEILGEPFRHYVHSVTVAEKLERNGKGLNLTSEVIDGILNHSKGKGDIISAEFSARTLEGQIVRIADIVAYINHDMDDAIRAGIIKKDDIPIEILKILGDTRGERISRIVEDIANTTVNLNYERIVASRDILNGISALRDFLFENVYECDRIKKEFDKACNILYSIYKNLLTDYRSVPEEYFFEDDLKKAVCYYMAGMTDRYAVNFYISKFMPSGFFG